MGGGGGGGKGSQGHRMDRRRTRGRGEEAEKAGGWEVVREKKAKKGTREAKKKAKEKERQQTGRRRGQGIGATCLWPARCSYTRWRVDGEALAAERPSCSLGYLPIKAGTLLFTQEDKATANPTASQREPPPEIPPITDTEK